MEGCPAFLSDFRGGEALESFKGDIISDKTKLIIKKELNLTETRYQN